MRATKILFKALKKACKNGYEYDYQYFMSRFSKTVLYNHNWSNQYYSIVFSNDFAKAFWGLSENSGGYPHGPVWEWQYHLQQMAIKEEPLLYLERFL